MSVSLYPVFNQPGSSFPMKSSGDGLGRFSPAFDEITEALSIRKFSSFENYPEITPDFDGEIEDLERLLEASNIWHSIEEGLSVFTKIREFLDRRTIIDGIGNLDYAKEELDALIATLHEASTSTSEFRLNAN